MYGLNGKVIAQPGRRDEVVHHLLKAAQLLEADPACIAYVVGTADEPDAVWVWEVWTDEAAHAASLERRDVRDLIRDAGPTIAGIFDQTRLEVHGGKGLTQARRSPH